MLDIKKENNSKLDYSLKLIAKTSLFVLMGLFLSKILAYVYRIIIARYFGPEAYGLFSLATMILGVFIVISSWGLVDGLLRYIPLYNAKKEIQKINFLLRFSIIILFISGVLFAIVLFLLSNAISINLFHNPKLAIYLKIFSFLIPVSILVNVFLFILRAYERVKEYSFLQNILSNAIKPVFLLFFIALGFNADNSIIFSFFIGVSIMFVMAYILSRDVIPNIFIKSDLSKVQKTEIRKSLFAYSWPLIFVGVIGNIFYWMDSFIIGFFRSAQEVGFYNAAVPIAGLLLIALEIFLQLFYPLITKEYSRKNLKLIEELSKQVAKWIFIINLPALLVMLVFPGVIINFLFGKEYLIAENSLRILALGTFFTSITSISGTLVNMIGKSRLILFNTLICSVLNLILNIFLVPSYGLNGAAFSTFISASLSGFLFIFWSYKYISIIPFRKEMIAISIICFLLFIPLLILEQAIIITPAILIIIGIFFLAIYSSIIYLTGCLDRRDLMILSSIRKKIFSR